MLELLRIANLALIEDVELEFAPGLNVLTGETGAGKSFIIKALSLLLGEKTRPEHVAPGADKARIEALFLLGERELVLRREIAAETGRSRLYLNDALSPSDAAKNLRAECLVNVSQHGREELGKPARQVELVDAFLPDPEVLAKRDAAQKAVRTAQAAITSLDEKIGELGARRDFIEHQKALIDAVNPKPGEEDALLARRELSKNQAKAQAAARAALDVLGAEDGLNAKLAEFARLAQTAAKAQGDPDLTLELAALDALRASLKDLETLLKRTEEGDDPDFDPEALEKRLYDLAQLKRKLKHPLDELAALAKAFDRDLAFLDQAELERKGLNRDLDAAVAALTTAVGALNADREQAARRFEDALKSALAGLGFAKEAHTPILFEERSPHPGLVEKIPRILFAPNPGQAPQPLDRIASGGELSRFLLALTGLKAKTGGPTLVFDEVDAGVGGKTLDAVAARLAELAQTTQVVVVTHWPQPAALAARHFLVEKNLADGRAVTRCRQLNQTERVHELARMLGGSEQAHTLAAQLLNHKTQG